MYHSLSYELRLRSSTNVLQRSWVLTDAVNVNIHMSVWYTMSRQVDV
jgi:hypothetical protein